MINSLKELRVAAIMDEFTELCYDPECILLQLTPQNWLKELTSFNPHLLFVESNWRGKDELWKGIGNVPTDALRGIVAYCKSHNIPTMFWNKEDPVHYDRYRPIAWMFDYIFTTDMDSIQYYKRDTGNDKVYFLHFAAQPKIHNPIEKFHREDKICFAGSYYPHHPERQIDFDNIMTAILQQHYDFDIYDRNFNIQNTSNKFPEVYFPYIKGTLPAKEIDKAYKGYVYNLNVNTIKESLTMFARRVFELMASNTIVISNHAKGIDTLFGNYVINSDDPQFIIKKLEFLKNDKISYEKYRLFGLRNVLKQHLYEDRVAFFVDKIFDKKLYYELPKITVFSVVKSLKEWEAVYKNFKRQDYSNASLMVFIPEDIYMNCADTKVCFIPIENMDRHIETMNPEEYIAYFDPTDYYGKNYLTDLALAFRFTDAETVCKKEHYKNTDSESQVLINGGEAYHFVKSAKIRRALFKAKLYRNVNNDGMLSGDCLFAIDPYNYCESFQGESLSLVDDLSDDYPYIDILNICEDSCLIKPAKRSLFKVLADEEFWLETTNDFVGARKTKNGNIRLIVSGNGDKREFLRGKILKIDRSKTYEFYMSGAFDFKYYFSCHYLDKKNKRIAQQGLHNATITQLIIPCDAVSMRIVARVEGEGKAFIHEFKLYERPAIGYSTKVSVIVPVYNTEKYVKECLNSITSQSFHDIEVICINDGSTDNSLEVIQELAKKDFRIRIFSQENKGPASTRNFGLSVAKGEYVLFVDSDDMLELNAIEYLYSEAKLNSLDILYFDAKSVFETKQLEEEKAGYKTYYVRDQEYSSVYTGKELFIRQMKDSTYRMSPCLQMIRRDFLTGNNISFYEGILHEDNLFSALAILSAKRVSHRNKQFYIRLLRENSVMTSKPSFRNIEGILVGAMELLKFQNLYNDNRDLFDEMSKYIDRLIMNAIKIYKKLPDSEKVKITDMPVDAQTLLSSMLVMDGHIEPGEIKKANTAISGWQVHLLQRIGKLIKEDGLK